MFYDSILDSKLFLAVVVKVTVILYPENLILTLLSKNSPEFSPFEENARVIEFANGIYLPTYDKR